MILVTGGARSGKSRHAEALIGDSSQVLYIATSQILDDEMAARIEHHRQGRPEHWRTVERWQHLDELIHADINPNEAMLLECVTTMVTNLLFDYGGDKDPDEWNYQAMEQAINAEIQSLIAACQRCPAKVVLVTNEVGMGIVPESRLALIFVVLAKILVLSELALRGEPILASLAAACAVSRGTAALLMYRHRYAREEGLGNVFIGKIDGRQTCVTLGLAAIFAAVLLPGMHGVAAMVVTMVAIFILGQLLKRTLGGQTGDTLGAAIELGELVFLLALL